MMVTPGTGMLVTGDPGDGWCPHSLCHPRAAAGAAAVPGVQRRAPRDRAEPGRAAAQDAGAAAAAAPEPAGAAGGAGDTGGHWVAPGGSGTPRSPVPPFPPPSPASPPSAAATTSWTSCSCAGCWRSRRWVTPREGTLRGQGDTPEVPQPPLVPTARGRALGLRRVPAALGQDGFQRQRQRRRRRAPQTLLQGTGGVPERPR